MSNRDRLLSDLRNLQYDRQAIQLMHDEIVRLNDDIVGHQNSHHSEGNSDVNTGDGFLCSPQNNENRSTCCPDPVYPADIHALQEERRRLTESLKLTVNHVARLERLLNMLSPEEKLVLDCMLINPYKRCTIDLMEELHCEMSSVYRLRARAIEKLLHLRYGAGAGE